MSIRFFPWSCSLGLAMLLAACSDTTPPPAATPAQPSLHTIEATDAAIATMGRTQIDGEDQVFGFPGVSFFVTADGSRLTATLSSSSENAWIDVIVDDGEPQLIQVPNTPTDVVLFDDLDARPHKVRITHRTENWQGQVRLHKLSLTGSGFLTAPALPDKRLLVLGDSVTCGEAIDREEEAPKISRWWNARESYGLLTADALGMQVQLVCWGGRGLVRSWNGVTDEGNLPEYYEIARGNVSEAIRWDHAQYPADMIVSAIGTNDFSQGIPDEAHYVDTYVKFLQKVMADYPDAKIVLIEGSILSGDKKEALSRYLDAVVTRLASNRVIHMPSPYHPGSPVDAHPTKAQHADMARVLAEQLRNL